MSTQNRINQNSPMRTLGHETDPQRRDRKLEQAILDLRREIELLKRKVSKLEG